MQKILIADGSPITQRIMTAAFFKAGYQVQTVQSGAELQAALHTETYRLLILDLYFPDTSAQETLEAVQLLKIKPHVIITAVSLTVNEVIDFVKGGADDCLIKPYEIHDLVVKVNQIFAADSVTAELHKPAGRPASPEDDSGVVVSGNPMMQQIEEMVERVKNFQTTVLITGESGTGKTLLAKRIHYTGSRRKLPFVHVNCAAIPPTLIESELFGYEKGAFTGANSTHRGKFEVAGKGTIFLDEIGLMPLNLQSKLLNVLQERRFDRVGGTEMIPMQARIIAATNANLEKCVSEGTFRSDLYYRLNVIQLELPPLRYRKDCIRELVESFLDKLCANMEIAPPQISDDYWSYLYGYSWPGNIRELENVVERSVVLCANGILDSSCLPIRITQNKNFSAASTGQMPYSLKFFLKQQEDAAILAALEKFDGHRGKTAQYLGISDRTLRYKLKDLNIVDPEGDDKE